MLFYCLAPCFCVQPPADLTPPLAEICLRLHLRLVCCHGHVKRFFCCTYEACDGRSTVRKENIAAHWFAQHAPMKYSCLTCYPPRQPIATTSTADLPPTCDYTFLEVADIRRHLCVHHKVTDFSRSNSARHFASGYECTECNSILDTQEHFIEHFNVRGSSSTTSNSSFRSHERV